MALPLNIICGAIGLTALVAGALTAANPAVEPGGIMPAALARLQRLATDSCRCERRAGERGKAACWASFERQMPGSELLGMCEPSIESRCVGDSCVVMGYGYLGHLLCTKEEVKAVDAVFRNELIATKGKGPVPKTEQLFRDIEAGKPLPKLDGPGGCMGEGS